jgi:D-lactate dehydrogenase (cytochrome)
VSLVELDAALAAAGRYYPPAPTFMGAFVGGTIATNAAGAATFRYGSTRQWVEAITVVLASGDVLDVARGQTRAHADGYFELELSRGTVRVPIGSYTMPRVAKLSAGYFAEPGMDLIDLFIGAEGTLGVITEATLRIVAERPAMCLLFVTFDSLATGLDCVRALRAQPFVSAIEHMDGRCLQLLREDRIDRLHSVELPPRAALALLATIELPAAYDAVRAYDDIADQNGATPLGRLAALLQSYDALDHAQIAAPGDTTRAGRLLALREAVPAGVNQRVARLKQTAGDRIEKVAADVIVPFDQIEALLSFCRRVLDTRGLDGAVWGHISDGNLHPNVIPLSARDVETGKQAMLDIGREAIRLGGAPLAEHGVGRNAIKQQLLRDLYGESGIDAMRRIKRALDPESKLAPGVLFPA